MVGRYWSRWYINLSDSFVIPSKMADIYQPCSRGDDYICRVMCSIFYFDAHGAPLDGTLGITFTKHFWVNLGKLQFAIGMGRFCNLNVFLSFVLVLVSVVS